MVGIRRFALQQSRQGRSAGPMHGGTHGGFDTLQIEGAVEVAIAENNAQQLIYFAGDFLLDDLRRFFSCAVCWLCSTGRRRQIFRFMSTKSSVSSTNLRYSAISLCALRIAAGEGKFCVTVLPSIFWVS